MQAAYFAKCGKPVKKMRFVPAEEAFAIARKLQGTRGFTVSAICTPEGLAAPFF